MVRKYPALTAWHEELRRGERATTTSDALWRAACTEATAQEFESIPDLHRILMRDAKRIIMDAIREGSQND